MQIFLITFVFMLAVVAAMSIGVIFNRDPIKGSCGGADSEDCACELAGKPRACDLKEESA
ncbi:MAG: hypothetical protein ACI91G_000743 [Gammaproteobacteria bacterium]|jgi:hypothetical protein